MVSMQPKTRGANDKDLTPVCSKPHTEAKVRREIEAMIQWEFDVGDGG